MLYADNSYSLTDYVFTAVNVRYVIFHIAY